MHTNNITNIIESVQRYYRINAYIALVLALLWSIGVLSYFLEEQLGGMLRILEFGLVIILLAFVIMVMLIAKSLKSNRKLLNEEPDDYSREVARKSYKITCGVVFLALGFVYLWAYMPLIGEQLEMVLPVRVFAEMVLCLMAAVYGVSYLALSREKNEVDG